MRPPELPGVLSRRDVARTGAAIAAEQQADGAIGWPDGHTDAWNHTECAMALLLAGERHAAERAFDWLVRNQREDGAWAVSYVGGEVADPDAESNMSAYVAVGTWLHWRVTRDRDRLAVMWPVVRRALDFVVGLQRPGGEIGWARGADGHPLRDVLLTGCSSILQSLRCGLALADLVGEPQPDWEVAAGALRHALQAHPEAFTPKDRWSMDWYYPVLGGALRGDAGRERLDAGWDAFVVPGLGARCVVEEPWVTGAETCELAIALHAVGRTGDAVRLVRQIQTMRHSSGGYWTGWQFANSVFWPHERSTWTAAAVVLAVDVLSGGPAEGVFVGDDLPVGLDATESVTGACGCPAEALRR